MARILDTDTEAFRSPEQKVVQRVPGETAREKWQTLGTMTEAIKGAVPLADLAVRGGSTLYGGIKDWFAEQEQKEEAEKAKARGAKKFEDDFAAAETKPQPGPTAAVTAGEQAAKPEEAPSFNQMEIARQRLEQMKAHELGIPQREPKLSLEHREAEAPKAPVEPSALDRLNLQRQHGQKPGELSLQTKPEDWFTEQRPQEESRVVGTYLPGRKEEATEYTRVPYAEPGKETKTPGFEPMWASSQSLRPEREQELGALLGKKPPMSIRQMKTPQPESPEMGEPKDWFQPELKLKGMPAASALTPAQRSAALQATMPEPTASGATTQGERLQMPTTTYTEERGGIPAGAMTAAPARIPIRHAALEGFPATTPSDFKTTATADTVSAAAAKPAEATKPVAPKTIGEATDAQLDKIRRGLEVAIKADPQNKTLLDRLKDVTDELKYRETRDIPVTYEQWSALARTADTPEKQARVLELAKNIHMPVTGLVDLFTPSSQLAERQALGTREERGLFPEIEKSKDLALRLKYIAQAEATGEISHAHAEELRAKAEMERRRGTLYGAQTETEVGMLPYKKGEAEEKTFKLHSEHEKLDAQTNAIRQKLGPELDLLKAKAARLRASGAGRGAGQADMFKWAKELDDVGAEMVKEAQKAAQEAINTAERASLNAQTAQQHAQMVGELVGEEPTRPVGATAAERIAYERNVMEWNRRKGLADAARKAADLATATKDKADAVARDAQTQMNESVKAGNSYRAEARNLYQKSTRRQFQPEGEAPAAPAAPAPKAAPKAGAQPVPQEPGALEQLGRFFGIGQQPAPAPKPEPGKPAPKSSGKQNAKKLLDSLE